MSARRRAAAAAVAVSVCGVGWVAPAHAAPVSAPESASASAAAVYLASRDVPAYWITKRQARQRPVLTRGMESTWVAEVQRVLRVDPRSGYFGPITEKAVKRFQRREGLRRDGEVRIAEWRRLGKRIAVPAAQAAPAPAAPAPTKPAPPAATAKPVLRKGMTSAWVRALQVELGVSPTSGYFGPITEAAVMALQTRNGLAPTGVVDAATWRLVGAAVAPPQDVTQTDAARTSRAHRASITVGQFTASPTAQQVVFKESRGQCNAVNPNGLYRGKWQMDVSFWSTYGGLAFAPRADLATCAQQDIVAHRGWIDRWWQPWPTAS